MEIKLYVNKNSVDDTGLVPEGAPDAVTAWK